MSSWYSINLGDAMLAGEPLDQIEALFLSAYTGAGEPVEMALFTRHESIGDLHCELIVYLAPTALGVAHALDAEPCDRPLPDGLSLQAGREQAWRLLFPESCE